MRGALNQADRYHSDHTFDGTSTEKQRYSRPRSGQLADFYALIRQGVSRLEPNTAEARRKIYDWALSAMVVQLYTLIPRLAESDIAGEQLAIEKAIRKVETESLHFSDPSEPLMPLPCLRSGPALSDMRAASTNAAAVSRSPPVANDEEGVGDDPISASKPVASSRESLVELEHLLNQIRHRRGSATIARKLLPISIMALLVFAAAAPSAH
jgi:hypothetical protein